MTTNFRNLPAIQIENDQLRVTVTSQGGHIAEVLHKPTGVNPLWVPPWPTIDLASYSPERHPEYGQDADSKLLAGILGHNLCLDLFGPPSPEEAAAGLVVHGEAGLVQYDIASEGDRLTAWATLPVAQLAFTRQMRLAGSKIFIRETVENLSILDRPIAWTQHVTLGPPFVESGKTQLRTRVVQSHRMGGGDFDWPWLPVDHVDKRDLRVYTSPQSGGYTAHLLDQAQESAWFCTYSPRSQPAFGYVWRRTDFPWLGIWEENRSRSNPPWNNRTMTWAMEFGVSPLPESRREMINRNTFFDTPCFRWIPAKAKLAVDYYCAIGKASAIPEMLLDLEQVTA